LLKERCVGLDIEFSGLMQADLIATLYCHLQKDHWWRPHTLLQASRWPRVTEIFARSKSKRYFENVKVLLGIAGRADLERLVSDGGRDWYPRWDHQTIDMEKFMAIKDLATAP
jgi:hypothetical protein